MTKARNDFPNYPSLPWIRGATRSGFFKTGTGLNRPERHESLNDFSHLISVITYDEIFYLLLKSYFIVNEHLSNMQSSSFHRAKRAPKIRENLSLDIILLVREDIENDLTFFLIDGHSFWVSSINSITMSLSSQRSNTSAY